MPHNPFSSSHTEAQAGPPPVQPDEAPPAYSAATSSSASAGVATEQRDGHLAVPGGGYDGHEGAAADHSDYTTDEEASADRAARTGQGLSSDERYDLDAETRPLPKGWRREWDVK